MTRRPGPRHPTVARLGVAVMALACASGCGRRDPMPPGVYAARHGILVAGRNDAPGSATVAGRDLAAVTVPAGAWFPCPFEPGAEIAVGGAFRAPATPTAVCLASIAPGSTRDGTSPAIAFTPDNAAIAVAGPRRRVALYELPDARRRWRRGLRGVPRAVAVSPNGVVAVAIDHAGIEVRALSLDSGRLVWTAALPSGRSREVIALSPTTAAGLVVARPGDGGDVSVLDIDSGALQWSVPAVPRAGYSVRAVGVDPARERVVLVVHPAGAEPILELRHADSGELLGEMPIPAADIAGVDRVDAVFGGNGRNVFLRTAGGWMRYPVRSDAPGLDAPEPVARRLADPAGPPPVAVGNWTLTVGADGDGAVLRVLNAAGAVGSTWRPPAGRRIGSVAAADGGSTVGVVLVPPQSGDPAATSPQLLLIEPGDTHAPVLRPSTAWTLADAAPAGLVCAPDGRFLAIAEVPSRGRTVVRILD